MRIFGWTGGEDGCAFYRVELPLLMMRSRGHTANWSDKRWEEQPPHTWIGQRISSPIASKQWMGLCHTSKYRTIYELDDDIWSIHESSKAAVGWSQESQQLAEMCISLADAVTTTTPFLADILRDLNPNVHVIPNTIPTLLLRAKPERHAGVNVAWGGSPTHAPDWKDFAETINCAIRAYPQSRLVITGPNYVGDAPHVLVRPWQKRVPGWWNSLADIDIGLAPLSDIRFNESKSFIKILEYAARGIPFVASNVGPYRMAGFGSHGVIGYFVETAEQWYYYLTELISDKRQREKMGRHAREWAAQYTIERYAEEWERVYFR